MSEIRRRLNILLIAGNTNGVHAVSEALKASNTRCRLLMIAAGPQTLPYLHREGRYEEAPRPDLVFFDAVDADAATIRLIKKIKAEDELKLLPLVLLTDDESMPALEDVRLGDTRYTAFSPIDLPSFLQALNSVKTGRFMQAIQQLDDVGFVLVRMPDKAERSSRAEALIPKKGMPRTDSWSRAAGRSRPRPPKARIRGC